jgi:two-component system sensor histidine kinase YesM
MNFDRPNYDRDMNIVRVQSSLEAIKKSSRFIDEVSVFLLEKEKIISTLDYGDFSDEDRFFLREVMSESEAVIHQSKEVMYIMNSFPFIRAENTVPSIISTVHFSKKLLKEAMLTYSGNNKAGALLFNKDRNFYLHSHEQEELKSYILENADLKKLKSTESIEYKNTSYLIAYTYSSVLDLYYLIYTPENIVFSKADNYKRSFWIFFFAVLLIMAIFFYLSYQIVHRPLARLVDAFRRVEKGDLGFSIDTDTAGEFGYITEGFNTMVGNLRSLIEQSYTQKILVQRSELKQLQAQINPHFLYNSFFILRRWIKQGDVENADQFSKYLGIYLQYIARSDSDEAPLYREIEHARIYAEIQAMRFSSRITLRFEDLPSAYRDLSVPRLIVQPVIENAFQYGLEDKEHDGKLIVSFKGDEDCLQIHIEDNGPGLSEGTLKDLQVRLEEKNTPQTTGLVNIHKRIVLFCGAASGLFLSKSSLGGLRVTLRLNFMDR